MNIFKLQIKKGNEKTVNLGISFVIMKKQLNRFVVFGFLFFACYFSVIQFIKFFKNEDVSTVSYGKLQFDSASKDRYPTYTICLGGIFGRILNKDKNIWKSSFVDPKKYFRFISGLHRNKK